MGKAIFKVDDNGKERFLVWSSHTDSPITFACTAEEIVTYFVEEAVERAKRDAQQMIERAQQTGTSSPMGVTLAHQSDYNRAGPDASTLTEDEIIEFYVRRKEEPTKPMLAAYRRQKR